MDSGHRLKLTIYAVVGLLGSVATYFASFDIFAIMFRGQGVLATISFVYFFLFLTIIFIIWAYRTFETIRKEKYANIASDVHQINHLIRNFISKYSDSDQSPATAREYTDHLRAMRDDLKDVCDRIANLFSMITSTSCRCAIKSFYNIGDNLYLYALCRDRKSNNAVFELDLRRRRENHDPLLANNAFARVSRGENGRWHFMSANVQTESNAHFTSISAYQNLVENRRPQRFLERLFENSPGLPYKALMACAVRQGPIDGIGDNRSELRGIVLVDSESRGVFVERWDIQLLFSFADALYHPLTIYRETEETAAAAGASLQPRENGLQG